MTSAWRGRSTGQGARGRGVAALGLLGRCRLRCSALLCPLWLLRAAAMGGESALPCSNRLRSPAVSPVRQQCALQRSHHKLTLLSADPHTVPPSRERSMAHGCGQEKSAPLTPSSFVHFDLRQSGKLLRSSLSRTQAGIHLTAACTRLAISVGVLRLTVNSHSGKRERLRKPRLCLAPSVCCDTAVCRCCCCTRLLLFTVRPYSVDGVTLLELSLAAAWEGSSCCRTAASRATAGSTKAKTTRRQRSTRLRLSTKGRRRVTASHTREMAAWRWRS